MADIFELLEQDELQADLAERTAAAPTIIPDSGQDVFSLLEGNAPAQPPQGVGQVPAGMFPGEGLGSFLGETSRRLVGGIAEAGAGVIQAGLEAVDFVFGDPSDPEPLAGQFADTFNAARDATSRASRAEFTDSMWFDGMEKFGEILPSFLIPVRGIAQGIGVGAAEGLAQFQDDPAQQSRLAAGATGAAFGGAASGLLKGIDFFRPGMFAARGVEDIPGKVASAKALSKQTGVDFKLSQILEDTGAESIEALAKTSLKGERMARAFENKQVLQSFKFMTNTARKLDPGKADFGTRIKGAFEGTAKKLVKIRKTQADVDFAAARKISGDLGVVPSNNTTAALDDILSKYNTEKELAVPAIRAFVKKVQGLREAFKEKPSMSVKELQNLLAQYGTASDGAGGIFSMVPKLDRFATKKIFMGLKDDLRLAGDAGVPGASELKVARLNYEANSQVIDELKSLTLAKLFKSKTMPPPEKIEQAFATMPPSQIKASMDMLGDVDPGLQQGLQRFILSRALSKGRASAAALPSGEIRFDPEATLKALNNDDTFKAVFNDARSRGQVMTGIRVLRKLGIGTSRPSLALNNKLQQGAQAGVGMNAGFVARFFAGALLPSAFAKVLFTKEGVDSLRLLAKPSTKPAVVAQIFVELEQMMDPGGSQ